ncbi:MAG: hypothetical protein ACI85O_001014 [Saprospiraceae bacterium]|jgi:hypothetical protein
MKNTLLFFLLTAALFLSSCKKEVVKSEWETYCDKNSLGGEMSLMIDGKKWETDCMTTFLTETMLAGVAYKTITFRAYNFGSTFYSGSSGEWLLMVYTETKEPGKDPEIGSVAGFYNVYIEDGEVLGKAGNNFASDLDLTPSDKITLTQLSSNKVEGTLDFKLFSPENGNEEISMTGSFEAVLQ